MPTGDFMCEHGLWLALCRRCNPDTGVKINNNAACAPTPYYYGTWTGESRTDPSVLMNFPNYKPQITCANPTFISGETCVFTGGIMSEKEKLGDDVEFNFNETETHNLNKLLKLLQKRLRSKKEVKITDNSSANVDVFSDDTLVSFLVLSLSEFNQTPNFTSLTFENKKFVDLCSEILVEGATLYALASQALLERGREFMLKEGGIKFTPPEVSEMLNTQYSILLNNHYEKLKYIKSNFAHLEKLLDNK